MGLILTLGLAVAVRQFRPLLLAVAARLTNPAEWGLFLRLLVRSFSGSTVLEFIVGPPTESTALGALDLMFCVVALAAGCGLYGALAAPTRPRCCLVQGVAGHGV